MLSQEEIKEMCDLMDGWYYLNFPGDGYDKIEVEYDEDYIKSYELCSKEWEKEIYPRFILEAIISINLNYNNENKNSNIRIYISDSAVTVKNIITEIDFFSIDEPKCNHVDGFTEAVRLFLELNKK